MKFGDIIEGETMQESKDELTGLSYKVIMEPKDLIKDQGYLSRMTRVRP